MTDRKRFQISVTEYLPINMQDVSAWVVYKRSRSNGPKNKPASRYQSQIAAHLSKILPNPPTPPHVFALSDQQLQDFADIAADGKAVGGIGQLLADELARPREAETFTHLLGQAGEAFACAYLSHKRQPNLEFFSRHPYQWPDGWFHRCEDRTEGMRELIQAPVESKFTRFWDDWQNQKVVTAKYLDTLRQLKFRCARPRFRIEAYFFSGSGRCHAGDIEIALVCLPIDTSHYLVDPVTLEVKRGSSRTEIIRTMDAANQKVQEDYLSDRLTLEKIHAARNESRDPKLILATIHDQFGPQPDSLTETLIGEVLKDKD